jgi:general secretion pathway protein F
MLKQSRMKNRVIAALLYPLIMVGVGSIVVTVLMTKVVPKLIVLVESRGGELPGPTALLKSISEFLGAYWYLLLLAVVLANMAVGAVRRTPAGRYRTDRILLGLPIFGDLFKKQAISRFAVTLSTLLKTGVPVLEALRIVRDIVGNSVLQRVLDDLHKAILQGADIATPLKRSGVFPPAVGYMIAVGEQSGELERVLDRLAEAYETEVEIATERLTAVIEPVMILIMAVLVAFIVMAIVLPMLQLGTT